MWTPHGNVHANQGITHFILGSRHTVQILPEVTGPRTMRVVSWNTGNKNTSVTTQIMKRLYLTGRNIYFKQMQASTKTRLQRAKRQDITYVGAVPR